MRVLVVGYPLPHSVMENFSVLTAPSYFDYDALVIDPAGITASVRELLDGEKEFSANDGRPVLNAPDTATVASIAVQVQRRNEETQRLLEAGRTVICIGRPNASQSGVLGFEGCDRFSWLPAPAGMTWGPPNIRPAEGKSIRVVREDHPLAPVFHEARRNMFYRAVFDDRQPGVRQGKVIATNTAGVPVSMEFEVLGGRVIFLPVPVQETGTIRLKTAQLIVDALEHLSRRLVIEPAPAWVRSAAIPGLEQVEAELEEAERGQREAATRVEEVRERHDRLANHRRLLSEDGPVFAQAVGEALELLGFARTNGGDEPLSVESEGQSAYVECEGSPERVVEWPYIRLQRRLEDRLLKEREQHKGIVVVNGYRVKATDERDQEYTEPLRIACENYRYCLVTGQTLFALVQRALGGADEAMLTGVRRRMLACNGLFDLEAALGETEPEPDAGPIF